MSEDTRMSGNSGVIGTVEQVYEGGATIRVTKQMVEDVRSMRALINAQMERANKALLWSMLGSRDPWPQAGFDFRENRDQNRYPEPDYCECCGRSDDD
jgi:hypothetical protein